jgi:hypothetical protein
MRGRPFDDDECVQGCFRDLAKIRLQNVETAQESIRGIDVTELAGACCHRLIAPQGRERFTAVQDSKRNRKRDFIQVMSTQGTRSPDGNEIISVHQIIDLGQIASLERIGQQLLERTSIGLRMHSYLSRDGMKTGDERVGSDGGEVRIS